jgi:hypothetical protein
MADGCSVGKVLPGRGRRGFIRSSKKNKKETNRLAAGEFIRFGN